MARYIAGRCPAFAKSSDGPMDASTERGARRMAQKIEGMWKLAGVTGVKVWVDLEAPKPGAMPRPVIRSNLRNGMPPQ